MFVNAKEGISSLKLRQSGPDQLETHPNFFCKARLRKPNDEKTFFSVTPNLESFPNSFTRWGVILDYRLPGVSRKVSHKLINSYKLGELRTFPHYYRRSQGGWTPPLVQQFNFFKMDQTYSPIY